MMEAVMTRYFWAAAAAIAFLAAPAQAAPHLPVGGAAAPLAAWITFCAQEPTECAVDQT
jgi:predicted transglutaminase-like cysteine proteinase